MNTRNLWILGLVVASSFSWAAKDASIPWRQIPGIKVDDYKESFLLQVAKLLEELPCYGRCTGTIAACLRKNSPNPTARQLAKDVFVLATENKTKEEIQKWVDERKRMAHPVETHDFNLEGLVPLGKKDAAVVVVVFSDFQCPFCAKISPSLERIVRESDGKTRLYLKQFPLKTHPQALDAAKACVAAETFGKFWELCGRLYEMQPDLSEANLLKAARAVGIDAEKFKKAMAKEEVLNRIADEKLEGLKNHIEGTPAIYINGKEVTVPATPELLKDRIEEEINISAGRD
jgi:protein-disulfide isomerase